jgi:hypothetical protein
VLDKLLVEQQAGDMELLLKVEDTFDIPAFGGLVVVPGPLAQDYGGAAKLEVQLRMPNGSTVQAMLTVQWISQTPPPKELRWGCVFQELSKADVPVGAEVWYEPDAQPVAAADGFAAR